MIQLKTESKREFLFIQSICMLLFLPSINYYLVSFQTAIPFGKLSYLLLFSLTIISQIALFRERHQMILWAYLATSVMIVFTYSLNGGQMAFWIFQNVSNVSNGLYSLCFMSIPAVFLMNCKIDQARLFRSLVVWSYVTIILETAVYFFLFRAADSELVGMSIAYGVTLPLMICIVDMVRRRNLISLILFGVGFISMTLCGSRGAVITVCVFSLLYFFMAREKKLSSKGVFSLLVVLALAVLLIAYYSQLLGMVDSVLQSNDLDSRVIDKLQEGEFFDDNGRNDIYESVVEGIKENPFGWGLWGDRFCNLKHIGKTSYAHNFELEIICHFGVVGGSVIIVYILFGMLRSLGRREKDTYMILFAAFTVQMIIKMQVSSSYLSEPFVFMLVGLLFRFRGERRLRSYVDQENYQNEAVAEKIPTDKIAAGK